MGCHHGNFSIFLSLQEFEQAEFIPIPPSLQSPSSASSSQDSHSLTNSMSGSMPNPPHPSENGTDGLLPPKVPPLCFAGLSSSGDSISIQLKKDEEMHHMFERIRQLELENKQVSICSLMKNTLCIRVLL